MKHYFTVLFALLLVVTAGTVPVPAETAVSPEGSSFTDDTLLPFNPAIRSGRLENGLEFYLLDHPHPEDTVMLRLIVDAGSVLETDGQAGLAHFVEHMAFNGTEEFDETELVAYLERLGMQFGPDVNAYTTFEETVYKLEVPANDPEALETGFRVMQQWASALAFEPDAIDRERGVIVEEWRRGQNAAQRILRSHIPVLLKDSRYAERLPIGDMDVVRNAPRLEFVDFYDRWYRPDNMAFVAVGDIPTDELTALTRRFLGDIPRPETPLDRPYHFVPFQNDTRISIATDTEAQRSTVSIYILDEPAPFERVHDYRALLARSIFASIMNERLRDLSRDTDSPITGAGLGWNRFLRGTEIAAATAVVRDGNVTGALELLLREVERANRFGVSAGELERARDRLFQSIDSARANYSSRSGAALADELVRFWTEGEAVPGIEIEYDLYHEILPSISTAEVSDVAKEFARDTQRVILAGLRVDANGSLPDGSPVPTEADLRSAIERISDLELRPGEDELLPEALIDPAGIPRGETIGETDHTAVETTELVLSNGMRVFVKPTELSDDEILFSAYSPGGLANVEAPLVPAAQLAPTVARESGVGMLDAATLEKFLSGRSVQLGTGIGRVSETMSGRSRTEDLELLFQLINLAFTAPRFDEDQLENVRQRTIQSIEGSRASPQGQFGRRLQELYANGDPRLRSLTEEEVRAVTIDQIAAVYRDRFADPADFALFFVGSLEPDEVRDLAEQYLAGIPSAMEPGNQRAAAFLETVAPAATSRPEGITADVVRAGEEPVGQVVALFHGPYEWSRRENHRFNSVAELFDIRLRERIREEAGGSYAVGAGGWRWREPETWSFLQISFGMDPDRREELFDIALEVVEEIRTTVASDDYVERIQAQQRESYRQSLQENEYWRSTLQFYVQHGRDLEEILTYPDLIDSLTGEELRDVAARTIDPERRIELVLLPENDSRSESD